MWWEAKGREGEREEDEMEEGEEEGDKGGKRRGWGQGKEGEEESWFMFHWVLLQL